MSRIDFILLSLSPIPKLINVGFASRKLSDHAPYWITVQLLVASPASKWRLNPFWLSGLKDQDDMPNEIQHFYS